MGKYTGETDLKGLEIAKAPFQTHRIRVVYWAPQWRHPRVEVTAELRGDIFGVRETSFGVSRRPGSNGTRGWVRARTTLRGPKWDGPKKNNEPSFSLQVIQNSERRLFYLSASESFIKDQRKLDRRKLASSHLPTSGQHHPQNSYAATKPSQLGDCCPHPLCKLLQDIPG